MRTLLHGTRGLVFAFVLALALPVSVAAQETRVVSGVVVDAESGAPVSDAVVTIQGTGLSVVTDPQGRFSVNAVPVGSQQLILRHLAYGEHAEALDVASSGSLDFQIRVSVRAIELEPLEVEVRSPEAQARRMAGSPTNVIDRAAIEAFPGGGGGLLPLLAGRIPSLRVDGNCVEYRYLQHAIIPDEANPEVSIIIPCRDITVYLDGVPDQQGSVLLQQLPPQDIERIQVLTPAEAGLQYVNGGRGVILVETRRGVARDMPDRIHVNGLGWEEPGSYPWLKVLGLSTLGSAAVAALTTRTAYDCSGLDVRIRPVRCQPAAGIAGAAVTSAIGRAITHGVGRTPYTEGRTYPALLVSVATASVGYMLYVHGENQGSDGSRVAGQIVLAVGVPITLTLSDRLFRMLR